MGNLKVVDVRVGTGPKALTGNRVTIRGVGRIANAPPFVDSQSTFWLGDGEVIAGWDQGIVGMKVGGLRRLTIPPALAYGDRGVLGLIPPGAELLFDIELLAIGSVQ
jgi:FKBP-type peptidyl-prolyl cis-trans isomerase